MIPAIWQMRWSAKTGGRLVIYSRIIILMVGMLLASSVVTQSGSTGGTLGKTKKSISGTVKKRVPVAKRKKNTVSRTNSLPNYQGTWRWKVQCPLSRIWTGTFTLNGPASSLHGNFTMDQPGGNGTLLGGSVNGSRIVFRRMTGLLNQTWDGVLSGAGKNAIIRGTASHARESCSFTARK
jgi:hypothetical protein